MIIDCTSDLHGYYPKLHGGDLLIIAGDLTARDEDTQYMEFMDWLEKQKYEMKIIVGGNHDNQIQNGIDLDFPDLGIVYLEDWGCEFAGLKIWGSPWTGRFLGQNKQAMAFSKWGDCSLEYHWNEIPGDTDILITHSPPYGILDLCPHGRVGSESLREKVLQIKPKLHVFGHIHGSGCQVLPFNNTLFINASYVDESYKPRGKTIRADISKSLSDTYEKASSQAAEPPNE